MRRTSRKNESVYKKKENAHNGEEPELMGTSDDDPGCLSFIGNSSYFDKILVIYSFPPAKTKK